MTYNWHYLHKILKVEREFLPVITFSKAFIGQLHIDNYTEAPQHETLIMNFL